MKETEKRLIACEHLMQLMAKIIDENLESIHASNPECLFDLKKLGIVGKCYHNRWPTPINHIYSSEEVETVGMEMAKYYETKNES